MKSPATTLAELQDYALSTTEYTPDEARLMLDRLDRFNAFLATQPYSNLRVRQRCLHLGLLHIMGVSIGRDTEVDLSPLISSGRWVEGPSYWDYTMEACEWLRKITGRVVDAPNVTDTYLSIVAPDGSLPLPEARDVMWRAVSEADLVSTPAYICKRWPSGAYLLVCVDPEIVMRDNLHTHPECGYFALYVGGEWAVRCKPYEGWDPSTLIDSNGLLQMLPPGAVLPTWRVKPPRIKVTRLPYGVEIRWSNGGWFDSKRTITWKDGVVRVADKWLGVRRSAREWRV